MITEIHNPTKERRPTPKRLITNIGIHFLDMLLWVFGPSEDVVVDTQTDEVVSGRLEFATAHVEFRLSIALGERQRLIEVDGQPLDFTTGFETLHTAVYRDILAGGGYGITDARPSIVLADKIRNA